MVSYSSIIYGAPQWIILFPVVVCSMFFLGWSAYKMYQARTILAAAVHRSRLLRSYSVIRLVIKTMLRMAVMICVMIALLRPRVEDADAAPLQEFGRDVVIVLDISRSMLASDYPENRLVCARKKIETLLNMLSCERVALVVFAGDALVQCPLTKDFFAFLLFLRSVDTASLSAGTTVLDTALLKALTVFDGQPGRKNKLLVLFTDGEDFSDNLEHVTEEAQAHGVALCTVGVGTSAGAPIPLYDHQGALVGHERDEHNKIVLSRLNEQALQTMAQKLHGLYVQADPNSSHDMERIKAWIDTIDKESFDTQSMRSYVELFPYVSGAALLCLLLAWLL